MQTLCRYRVRVHCCSCMQVWLACGGTAYGNVVLPPGCGLLTPCAAEKKGENSDEAENACAAYGCACGHVVTPVELPFCGGTIWCVALILCPFGAEYYTKMFPCVAVPPPARSTAPCAFCAATGKRRGFCSGEVQAARGSTCTLYRLRLLCIFHIIDDALDCLRLAGHFRNGV